MKPFQKELEEIDKKIKELSTGILKDGRQVNMELHGARWHGDGSGVIVDKNKEITFILDNIKNI